MSKPKVSVLRYTERCERENLAAAWIIIKAPAIYPIGSFLRRWAEQIITTNNQTIRAGV